MIVFIRGEVAASGQAYVNVNVSGIGYRVFVPESVASDVTAGESILLYTHHHIREDAQVLYGFLDERDRDWFELLLSVSGIGPKGALALVSASTYEDFLTAIAMEDAAYLCTMPGVGKKTAGRLLVELKDKVPQQWLSPLTKPAAKASSVQSRRPRQPSLQADLIEALISLGYNERQASETVTQVIADDAEMPLEQALTLCLQQMDRIRK